MIIIDAQNAIVGRFATIAAKQALLGNEVAIINCEHAVISGNKKRVLADWKRVQDMGVPRKGPYVHRHPERFVRRMIRGMLPYKKPRGAEAFARIKCYVGAPELKGDKIKVATTDKLPTTKYVTIKEICKTLGGKHGEE